MPTEYILYVLSILIINFVYIAVYLGIFISVPQYIITWYTFLQISLCILLMYRYNPFQEKFPFTVFDARVIFGVSWLLLLHVASVPFFSFLHKIVNTPFIQTHFPDLPKKIEALHPSVSCPS